ncbi:MAG TPA: tRNA uridine-5-carboxymethylaminomethyl(34) synthesis GTPase MnmE, partial [Aquifex sp.]|nr:tRNA uridine-5-carboxymethylaminomethyl(34) synthesis GTPase MnmE [Aquifex sp.]
DLSDFPLKGVPVVEVSAKSGEGIEKLREEILKAVGVQAGEGGNIYISVRHEELLKRAKAALENALRYLEEGEFYSPEILMLDLREASDALGEIVGEVTTEDVLGQIFSTFCIGK